MSGFISANPDDDFLSDREAEWRKYARGMEAFRGKQAATISQLQAEIARYRGALAFFADEKSWRVNGPCDPNSGNFNGIQFARTALGCSNDKG